MMEQQAVDMLRQVLSHAKKAEDFATIRSMVNEAQEHVRTQSEYWRVALPGQVKDVVFAGCPVPVLPMQVIALDLDKGNNDRTGDDS